ncbi:MAG: hypothetical protein JNL70_10390 [Saprospiraceae bacterium]|nr:hypothetical protein [Saprospiraceae bacterium]
MIFKRLLSALLIATILLQTCSTIAVVVSFKINQDYISTYLCVNRDKPQLQCNGKCVLMQRMQQEINNLNEHDRQNVKHIIEHEVLLFCENVPFIDIFNKPQSLSKKLTINDFEHLSKSQLLYDSFFHPPTV